MIVLGIDVGGTKIKAGAVRLDPSADPVVVAAAQVPTPRCAPANFYDQLVDLCRRVIAHAQEPVQPVAAMAHPGRFLPDGIIARGTTPNLGEHPNQFDGLSPAQELQRRLGGMVVAENDAMSQMRYAIHALLRDASTRSRLLNQMVVYLGPGTGMGGGVARIDAKGRVTALTDGQLFDLQVPSYGPGTLTAEEIFTGPAIGRRIEAANKGLAVPILPAKGEQLVPLLSDPAAPAAQRSVARLIMAEFGDILAHLIVTVQTGSLMKVRLETGTDGQIIRHVEEPDRAWSAADQSAVAGATRFVLGGSVGVNPMMGKALRAQALETLQRWGYTSIEIIQSPVPSADAGLLGAVLAIPPAATAAPEIERAGESGPPGRC